VCRQHRIVSTTGFQSAGVQKSEGEARDHRYHGQQRGLRVLLI
jgi:hypothetical protein